MLWRFRGGLQSFRPATQLLCGRQGRGNHRPQRNPPRAATLRANSHSSRQTRTSNSGNTAPVTPVSAHTGVTA